MKLFVFLTAALLAAAQAQNVLQSQDASQTQEVVQQQDASQEQEQEEINTPKPTVKYLDIKEALATKYPMPTRNVTIRPTRPDPRQEPPTEAPTMPPTPAPTPPPTPAPTSPPAPWVTKTINHDAVKPFPQPEPVTISEKAAIKFKPQIRIATGCVPYPAVNDVGETSGGLQTSGSPKGGCRGSGHGSQVYGRAGWFNDVWAIMYSWYFPKDSPSSRMGHRHDWEHVVVWINNPDVPDPKILGISASAHSGYKKYAPPPPENLDGNSVKVNYEHAWPINHALDTTDKAGTFQDLIMWEQMTEDARRALNAVHFGKANTPMNDGNFRHKLEKAWPF